MGTNYHFLKRVGIFGTVCSGLLLGLAVAPRPAAADCNFLGNSRTGPSLDYGSSESTGVSILNYGENNDNLGGSCNQSTDMSQNDSYSTDESSDRRGISPDYGSRTPDGTSINNYGGNNQNIGSPTNPNTGTTPNYTTPSNPSNGAGSTRIGPSPDYGTREPDGTSINNYGENNQNIGGPTNPNADTTPNYTAPSNGAGNSMNGPTPSPDYGSQEPEGPSINNYGENNAR